MTLPGFTPSLSRESKVLAALTCLLPPVAVYAPKGTVVLASVVAAGLLTSSAVRSTIRATLLAPIAWAIAPLMVWGLIAVLWSPSPGDALGLWVAIIALIMIARVLVLGAAMVDTTDRQRLAGFFVIGAVLFVAILAVENIGDGVIIKLLKGSRGKGVSDYLAWINPGNTVLAVMALPFAAGVARWGGPRAGTGAFIAALVVVALGPSTTAILAAMVAGATFLLTLGGKRVFLIFMAGVLALGQLSMPTLVGQVPNWKWLHQALLEAPVSIVHRWKIWEFVTGRIAEHPVVGWGLDASRAIPGANTNVFGEYGEILPLHPHSGFLQIWLELGGIGAIAMAVFLVSAPFLLHRAAGNWPTTAIFMGTLAAYMAVGQLSYGIWQNWWIATGILGLALAMAGRKEPFRQETDEGKP
jgi:exopolysaccharide production protein ExoQ